MLKSDGLENCWIIQRGISDVFETKNTHVLTRITFHFHNDWLTEDRASFCNYSQNVFRKQNEAHINRNPSFTWDLLDSEL